MNNSYDITFEDLQRTAIQVWDDSLGAMVYRLGDFDTTPPLLLRQSDDGNMYYSLMFFAHNHRLFQLTRRYI